MKIAVIGTGYVGLVSGTCFAAWGYEVVCVDKDAQKIQGLQRGALPIYEPGLGELVERNSAIGRLSFTCNLAEALEGAAVVFIAVGTPPRAGHGDADLSFVYMAARELAPLIEDNTVVVVKSTVPVGTGDVVQKIIGSVRKARTFSVASNPEFLREGVAILDFLEPDRVVIGIEDEFARKVLTTLYGIPLEARKTPIVVTQRRTSELIKYAANAFLATKITFINELADLCEQVGSNVGELALGMGLDKRIGTSFLNAGPGYGGSCFPKDTLALLRTAQDYGVSVRIVQETVTANEARKRRMALKVMDALDADVEGRTIAVLGLTFKPDTDDMRDAPSVPLIETLQRFGANIRVHDPVGMENASHVLSDVEFCDDAYECARGADAAVVITEWDSIRKLDLARLKKTMRQAVLIDLRNAFEPALRKKSAFAYRRLAARLRPGMKPRPCSHTQRRTTIEDDRHGPLLPNWREVPMSISKSERARFLPGLWVRTAVAWTAFCIAAPTTFAASSQDSVLPEGTRPMTASEIYELYKDKSWQWDDGAGRMTGGPARTFSAWADGEEGKSWAEGRWVITETGRMCLNATWHTEQGAFPAKTCFSHRIGNGAIHLMREPDGEWFMFRHAEIRDDDEANKLVSADLVSQQRDNIRTMLGAAPSPEQ